jgi:hypothetical protein
LNSRNTTVFKTCCRLNSLTFSQNTNYVLAITLLGQFHFAKAGVEKISGIEEEGIRQKFNFLNQHLSLNFIDLELFAF